MIRKPVPKKPVLANDALERWPTRVAVVAYGKNKVYEPLSVDMWDKHGSRLLTVNGPRALVGWATHNGVKIQTYHIPLLSILSPRSLTHSSRLSSSALKLSSVFADNLDLVILTPQCTNFGSCASPAGTCWPGCPLTEPNAQPPPKGVAGSTVWTAGSRSTSMICFSAW